MNSAQLCRMLVLTFAVSIVGCGGGGGGIASVGSGGGIGGTGLSSSGTISGFGSIFVNGVEFETDEAVILIDGQAAGEQDLGLGMVVLVTGVLNDDGVTGSAERVVFDDEVEGPIDSILPGRDGDSLLLSVLGLEVIVERTGTVFEDVSFDTLTVGDVVEVSGFPGDQGTLRATRLEKEDDFVPGVSEIELKGVVADLVGTEFTLRGFTVDYSAAELENIPGDALVDGMPVEVVGTVDGDRITATRVEQEDDLADAFGDDQEVSVEGTITRYVTDADFLVDGVAVNAVNATLQPAALMLRNGLVVEAEGRWDGSVLRARKVEARRGRVEIEAAVSSVDASAQSLSLQLATGIVTVQLNRRTLLEDDTGMTEPLTLADIHSGDFLEVEAIMEGDSLVATRIDRDRMDDDIVQAPVQSFESGSSLTLLGVTYSTEGARFENQDDVPLTAEQFYSAVQVGTLVKIKDEQLADGIADEVEFEFQDGLDGEREFGDDEDEDESDDAESEDESEDESEAEDESGSEDNSGSEDEPEDET